MNMDDFLDTESGSSKTDVIDISGESSESDVPTPLEAESETVSSLPNSDIPVPTPEPSVASEPEVPSPEDQTASMIDSQTVIQEEENLQATQEKTQAKTTDSQSESSAPSSPSTPKKVAPDLNEVSINSLEVSVQAVINAIKSKDLISAMSHYKELRVEYAAIPMKNISAKRELHNLLVKLNDKIAHLSEELHHTTEELLQKIITLIQEGVELLTHNSLGKAETLGKEIRELFLKIPLQSDPKVQSVRSQIQSFYAKIKESKYKILLIKTKKQIVHISHLVVEVEKNLRDKHMGEAEKMLVAAENQFANLPELQIPEKVALYSMLTKQRYAFDVITQIGSLQTELDNLPGTYPDTFPSFSDAELSEELSDDSSQSSETNTPLHSESVDAAVRKLKVKKIKIDILNGQYTKAKTMIDSLEHQFGSSDEISSLKLLLAKKMKESPKKTINTELDKELSIVEKDIKKGDFYDAEKEMKEFKKEHDGAYLALADEIEKDVEDAEESYYFSRLKEALADSDNTAISDPVLRKISRKLILAKHQMNKGDSLKAKQTLQDIFKLDPNNKDALEIMELVKE